MKINTSAWIIVVKFADGGYAVHGPWESQGMASGFRDDVIRRYRDMGAVRPIDDIRILPLMPL